MSLRTAWVEEEVVKRKCQTVATTADRLTATLDVFAADAAAHPDDPAPVNACADWLVENGVPLADVLAWFAGDPEEGWLAGTHAVDDAKRRVLAGYLKQTEPDYGIGGTKRWEVVEPAR